jgi:hypothetical protein
VIKTPQSIRNISLYGFAVLILGALVSGVAVAYLAFDYSAVVARQRAVEDAYKSVLALKYHTERLLSTPELIKQRQSWDASVNDFERQQLAPHPARNRWHQGAVGQSGIQRKQLAGKILAAPFRRRFECQRKR